MIYQANWPAPTHIKAFATTRMSGSSLAPFDHNNLALHVDDDPAKVLYNRQVLMQTCHFQQEPAWLNQTHSAQCVVVEEDQDREADAAITRLKEQPLVILTADCLPILLCNRSGDEIAAIHAGWRGLYAGIIEHTLAKLQNPASELLAWVGPAICQNCYEVGDDVYLPFTSKYPFTQSAFRAVKDKWLCNLTAMAEMILNAHGLFSVYHAHLCTFELKNEFYSYRRSAKTGRIGSFICIHDRN
jgi:YfiH family protein